MNVLACFAHPDDEVLGAGGTLAKHVEAGDTAEILVLCRKELEDQQWKAASALGCFTSSNWAFPDQRLEFESAAKIASSIRKSFDPDVVYTHHPGDLNLDHALTARAVLTAFRPKPGEKPRTILACEVPSSTEYTFPAQFQANWFEKLDHKHVQKKCKALGCYPSEEQFSPHPRSRVGIGNLARVRGQQCGVPFAEAFQLLRRGPC